MYASTIKFGNMSKKKKNRERAVLQGFPGISVVKNPPAIAENAGETDSIPGSERSSGVGNGNPLQYLCLENSMGRGGWQATVYVAMGPQRVGHD